MTVLRIETPRAFVPLLKPARRKGAYGGRGSGKSHHFAEALVERCVEVPGTRVVCVREVQKSLKESAKRLIEDKIEALGVGSMFEVQSDQIKTPGGGVVIFQGMQDHTAESIKSLEGFTVAWAEEAQTMTARSLELLVPTIRAPNSELWFSWNPRSAADPVDAMFRGPDANPDDPDMIAVKVNYDANPWFPDVLEYERQRDRVSNPHRYAHTWLGEYEPMAVGAIWTAQTIHDHRRQDVPDDLERIVVAVDPAVTSGEAADDHGIIVCGIDSARRGYVLDDMSCHGEPDKWARRAIAALDKWDADAIVIEVNQGGDMVKHTLKTVRQGVRIVEVRATKGKHVRAEPIAALYAEGRVSHVGTFPELETEMLQMTAAGYEGHGSCDRVDALVWSMTELFPRIVKRETAHRPAPTKTNSAYNPHRAWGR